MLYLPRQQFGCGVTPLAPTYAQICAATVCACLNDAGRLGELSRLTIQSQLRHCKNANVQEPKTAWVSKNSHMLLRQAAIVSMHGMQTRYNNVSHVVFQYKDLFRLCNAVCQVKGVILTVADMQAHILCPLWSQGVYNTTSLLVNGALKPLHEVQDASHWPSSARRAYQLLLHLCCSGQGGPTDLSASALGPLQAANLELNTQLAPHVMPARNSHWQARKQLELDSIIRPASMEASCNELLVSWCPPNVGQAQPVCRMHEYDVHASADGKKWLDCRLPIFTVQALWPGKWSAFVAIHAGRLMQALLLRVREGGGALDRLLHGAHMHSQGVAAMTYTPPFGRRHGKLVIQFDEVNPDHDIKPMGHACLVRNDNASVACYDMRGKYAGNIHQQGIGVLTKLYGSTDLNAFSFAHDVVSLAMACIREARAHKSAELHKHYALLPDRMLCDLVSFFGIQYQWLTSPLTVCSDISCYSSHPTSPEHEPFCRKADAFTYQ